MRTRPLFLRESQTGGGGAMAAGAAKCLAVARVPTPPVKVSRRYAAARPSAIAVSRLGRVTVRTPFEISASIALKSKPVPSLSRSR